jgi:hypothetical protein
LLLSEKNKVLTTITTDDYCNDVGDGFGLILMQDYNDMRWKLNDALEIKRKIEADNETLKFEIENIRSRYIIDMREREVR